MHGRVKVCQKHFKLSGLVIFARLVILDYAVTSNVTLFSGIVTLPQRVLSLSPPSRPMRLPIKNAHTATAHTR